MAVGTTDRPRDFSEERGELEDLPPLELRRLRDLDFEPSADGPAHLAAGSGVVRRGDFIYVIGDDLLDLGEFVLSTGEPGRLRPALAAAPGSDKADLEALTALPPIDGHPYGGLAGFGSGSRRSRDHGFWWPFASDGSLVGEPVPLDLRPSYDRLRTELPDLNIEGAAVMAGTLWLFHRATGDQPNAVAELSLEHVERSLREDQRLDCEELVGLRRYDLGRLDHVPLAFSDATPLADHVVVFTASAEDTRTGGIHGSVVGTIDRDGSVRRLRTIDRRWKVEGVHASIDTGVLDLVFVCDQDDPDVPSPLLSATMPIDGRIELERDRGLR